MKTPKTPKKTPKTSRAAKAPRLKDQPRPFFLEFLRQRQVAEGGHKALAESITRAYRNNVVDPASFKKTDCIDRRKLKRLLDHDRTVVLSLIELESVHAYLDSFDLGLTRRPFFKHSSIVEELAAKRDATFLLGSRMSLEGPELSYWDMQAMARIQRTVHELSTTTFDFVDVPHGRVRGKTPEWTKLLAPEFEASLIFIGSERSNAATLRALKTMLGQPLGKPSRWSALPFYFVLFDGHASGMTRDSMSRAASDLPKMHAGLAARIAHGVGWGLVIGESSFLSQAATRESSRGGRRILQERVLSHGLIAAQRQPGGQIWVVVAGLTGPGTLAAAANLTAIQRSLPQATDPHWDAVLWAVVETMVDTTPISSNRGPELLDSATVVRPSLWDPHSGCRLG